MGDGRRLKELLDERNMSVRSVAKQAGISPTTLYTIVQNDTAIRFDFALRIANVLDISHVETTNIGYGFADFPVNPIVIKTIVRIS